MDEITRIKKLLDENNIVAKKSFGQNFLINDGIIEKIIASLEILNTDSLIEIGPGLGSLTIPLSTICNKLIAVDADRDMVKILNKIFLNQSNVTILESDFLKFDPDKYSKSNDRIFIGNLPYNITSSLIEYLLLKGFNKAGIMVQKEVADKLTYKKDKKENNALSAFLNAQVKIASRIEVDSSSFLPVPKVDSSFLVFKHTKDIDYSLYSIFKILFKDSNKTTSNCLKQSKYKDKIAIIQDSEYKDLLSLRARQLDVDTLVAFSNFIYSI